MSSSDLLALLLTQSEQPLLSLQQEEAFDDYLSLLLKWNAKLNLTSIRDRDTILHRHFLECIFCARQIPNEVQSLLDFGSGGGFPGIPIAICRPEIQVTLGESQNKKAVFLREVIRSLHLNARVEQGRAEDLPVTFDVVALRAVDKMELAIPLAEARTGEGGCLVLMAGLRDKARFCELAPQTTWGSPIPIPGSEEGCILLGRKSR